MKNLKISVLISAALLLLPSVNAQEVHSMRATIGGGMHSHIFGSELFNNSMGGGMRVDVEYAYYFHTNVGVQTGLSFDWSNSRIKGNYTVREEQFDEYNHMRRTIIAEFTDFSEHQSTYNITLPIAVRGRFYIAKGWTVLPAIGLQARFICGGRQKAESGRVAISGYYPDLELIIDPDVPQHGFSIYDVAYNEKTKYRPVNLDVTADVTFDYQIDNVIGISFGPYFSCSTINALKGSDQSLVVVYNSDTPPAYNGIFNSHWINKMHPISVGFRVGVSFRLGRDRYSRYNPWN